MSAGLDRELQAFGVKGQSTRLADVVVIGPLMGYGGWLLRSSHPVIGWALVGIGFSTVLYNWENYRKVQTEKVS